MVEVVVFNNPWKGNNSGINEITKRHVGETLWRVVKDNRHICTVEQLDELKETTSYGLRRNNLPVLCVITAPISIIFSNQEKTTFDLVSLAIVLCSFLSMGLIIIPERNGQA
ncbi:hypothetical protein RRG08_007343 [Elysia crispata]|uniref:Uncharacterized protein n=1 Tax=Elysia crispata TaxID=231223 RepID=A0AAE1AQT5_9GAST|nr:hypothetical protein RRG08_007343 [Elysia crispata]